MDINKLLESKRPKVADLKQVIVELQQSTDNKSISDSKTIEMLQCRIHDLSDLIARKKDIIDKLSNDLFYANEQYQKLLKENKKLIIRCKTKRAIYVLALTLSILFNLIFALS